MRIVDITVQSYQIARQYVIRLSEEDFKDPVALVRHAALAGMSPEVFRSRFQSVDLTSRETQLKGRAT